MQGESRHPATQRHKHYSSNAHDKSAGLANAANDTVEGVYSFVQPSTLLHLPRISLKFLPVLELQTHQESINEHYKIIKKVQLKYQHTLTPLQELGSYRMLQEELDKDSR